MFPIFFRYLEKKSFGYRTWRWKETRATEASSVNSEMISTPEEERSVPFLYGWLHEDGLQGVLGKATETKEVILKSLLLWIGSGAFFHFFFFHIPGVSDCGSWNESLFVRPSLMVSDRNITSHRWINACMFLCTFQDVCGAPESSFNKSQDMKRTC